MIEIDLNTDAVAAALARLAAATDDMSPVFQDIGEYLVKSTQDRFGEGAAPDGSAWAAKSQTTLDAYARRKDPADPRPLFGPSRSLYTTIFARPGPDRVEVGSPKVYAAMMHFGGAKSAFPHLWGDIPARPFLGLSDEDEAAVLDIVAEHLEAASGD